ncbi:hypothetical protein E2C01_074883 [Portunus trituberculatus]|uniref:Uncharacterized protein n=1 Tax=Portunus trituberculatus TaxID=210409 RepID=A0A5B7IFF8_PORTR|nr:hypothetical protein [Portunus trituberculatus]
MGRFSFVLWTSSPQLTVLRETDETSIGSYGEAVVMVVVAAAAAAVVVLVVVGEASRARRWWETGSKQ